jgi:hypothetical protein
MTSFAIVIFSVSGDVTKAISSCPSWNSFIDRLVYTEHREKGKKGKRGEHSKVGEGTRVRVGMCEKIEWRTSEKMGVKMKGRIRGRMCVTVSTG